MLWNLTGGAAHATDPSNASRTMLFDIRALDWSDELLDLFSVPRSMLPEVRPSSGIGSARRSTAPAWRRASRSCGIAGDQQAALFGQACFAPGMTKNTYGTGSFVLMNVGADLPSPGRRAAHHRRVDARRRVTRVRTRRRHLRHRRGDPVAARRPGHHRDAAEIGPLAASCPDTEGVYIVPAFTGLGSPWWDPYARGTIVGITRGTGRAHLARAVVEAMAYQTRDVVDAMEAASGRGRVALRADGGAAVMDLLLQLQADQLQVPVARPTVAETTALGAAYLAGLAEGVWGSLDELAEHWHLDREFTPEASAAAADQRYAGWRRAVDRSRT